MKSQSFFFAILHNIHICIYMHMVRSRTSRSHRSKGMDSYGRRMHAASSVPRRVHRWRGTTPHTAQNFPRTWVRAIYITNMAIPGRLARLHPTVRSVPRGSHILKTTSDYSSPSGDTSIHLRGTRTSRFSYIIYFLHIIVSYIYNIYMLICDNYLYITMG